MLTRDRAVKVRKAIWSDSDVYGSEHAAFCEEHGIEESEVWEFLDSAVAFCERQEDAIRAKSALDLGVTIETNQQKRDGSFITQFRIEGSTESYARLMNARGKGLRMKLYDPQEELPLEYGPQPTAEGPVPIGGLLPLPVEVEVVEEEAEEEE